MGPRCQVCWEYRVDRGALANLSSLVLLPAGCYRFEVWANSHSSSAPYADGLIEVNGYPSPTSDTYGYMVLKTFKAD